MQGDIKLSIIIPIYNAQRYLEKCLNSVISCPSSQIECILVNDGSVDNSLKICQEYITKDSRFQIINKKNEGVSIARNTGMQQALGDYIFFLDADDYLNEVKWKNIIEAIDRGYDFTAFSYYTLDEKNTITEELFPLTGKETTEIKELNKLLLTTALLNTCWGKLLKKEIIFENRISFPENMKTGEDAVFILDYLQHIKNCNVVNESILYYRQHSNSAMHQINLAGKLSDFEVLYQHRVVVFQRLKDLELEKEAYRQFFSVITNLFLEFAKKRSLRESKITYSKVFQSEMVQEIIKYTPYQRLTPVYKKLEYQLLQKRRFGALAIYFKCKSMLR